MPSQALMCERKALPSPWPSDAPLTKPAMSTTLRKAGTLLKKGKLNVKKKIHIFSTQITYVVRIKEICKCRRLFRLISRDSLVSKIRYSRGIRFCIDGKIIEQLLTWQACSSHRDSRTSSLARGRDVLEQIEPS